MPPPFITVVPTIGTHNNIGFVNVGFPDGNSLFRTDPKGNRVRLSRGIGVNGAYTDFQAASGVKYLYHGVASYAGVELEVGSVADAVLTLSTGVLHKVAKGNFSNNADANLGVFELYNQEGQRDTRTRLGNVLVMPADAKPEIATSPLLGRTLSIPVFVPQSSISVFRALKVAMKTDDLWCYRDGLGTHMFGTFLAQSLEEDLNGEVTISMVGCRYFENVE